MRLLVANSFHGSPPLTIMRVGVWSCEVSRQRVIYRIVLVAVSLLGVMLFQGVLRIFDNHQTVYEAELRFNHWQHRLEKRTSQVQHAADLLGESHRLTESAFYRHLIPLAQEDPAFHCAEWQPRVEVTERQAFVTSIRRDLKEKEVRLVAADGGEIGPDEVVYPIRYSTSKPRRARLGPR